MKDRWLPVGVLAGVLFTINVLGRWAAKLFAAHSDSRTTGIGVVALVAVAVVTALAAYRWDTRYPFPRVVGDLVLGMVAGCLLTMLVAPLLAGTTPVHDGVDFFMGQLWRWLALAVGGAGFGLLVAMALGRDHKSQSWKRYAEQFGAKPKRVVRR